METNITLPSRYMHNQEVRHILVDNSKVHKSKIIKIHFTQSKVSYDIELECYWPEGETPKPGFEGPVKENFFYRMYNIPSAFLQPVE